MTTPITSSTTPSTATSASVPAATLGTDAFLQLFVAQLRYQDPSKPVDSAEFMAQSAQFTMVERLEEMSRQSTEMLAQQRLATAASYIGRTVEVPGPDSTTRGTVTSVTLDPRDGPVLHLDGGHAIPLTGLSTFTVTDGRATTATDGVTDPGPTTLPQ